DRLAGKSAIGFLPVPKGEKPDDALRALLAEVDAAIAEGHEIGTHFNGHWCGDGGIGDWDSDDWREEIDEFRRLVTDINRNNALDPPITTALTAKMIVGARTPCLEGDRLELDAALRSAGFRYDASRPGVKGEWPRREYGLWSFPVPPLRLPDAPHPVLAYDYNLYAHTLAGNPDVEDPEVAAHSEKEAYDALIAAFDESYYGSRAPFAVGSHFERWNHSAYTLAIGRFLEEVCVRPEVRCESFSALADWLDAQSAGDLARMKRGDFERLARHPAKSRASR
ncbi:MAG TPA: hypothetical protein VMV18_06135, partial [bacterium]|nr:hypothetical protein [bacterium]